MKKTITITISRQFGSNGREIGRKLAEYLDIGYYNKEIMEKIAKDMGVSSDFLMRTIKMKMVYILYPTVSLEVCAALQN